MPFKTDSTLAEDVGTNFGEYLSTFVSETGQVVADIFRCGDRLVAHVSFPTKLKPYDVTDGFVNELWEFAREAGYEDRFEMIFAES